MGAGVFPASNLNTGLIMLTEITQPKSRVAEVMLSNKNRDLDRHSCATWFDAESMQTIKAEWKMITPQMADTMLATTENVGFQNRKLKTWKIDQYVRDIQNEKWATTNQTIGVLSNGAVIDGQHRLHAILKSNRPLPMLVVTGLPPEAFSFIDIGVPRSLADSLRFDHSKNATLMAATGKFLAHYIKGSMRYFNGGKDRPTNQECIQALQEYPEAQEWANTLAARKNTRRYASLTMAVGLSVLYERHFPDATRENLLDFWDILMEYKMPTNINSSVVAYRKRYGDLESRKVLTRLDQMKALAWAIHGHLKGKEVKQLRIPEDLPNFLN